MRTDVIYGRNAVAEAIKSQRPLDKVYLQKGLVSDYFKKLLYTVRKNDIPFVLVEKAALDRISEGGNHQGIAATVAFKAFVSLDYLLQKAAKAPEPFLLVLAQVFDPHNLGALVRTAEGGGADGIIIPRRNSCGLTSTVAKVSAGALEYLPVCRVTNIALTLDQLREEGYKIIGAEAKAEKDYAKISYRGSIALLLGGEDKALSPHLQKRCDEMVKIPIRGKISSLNLSVAGAVIIFEALRQRRNTG